MFPPDQYEFGRRLVLAAFVVVAAVYALRIVKAFYLAMGG